MFHDKDKRTQQGALLPQSCIDNVNEVDANNDDTDNKTIVTIVIAECIATQAINS